MKTPLLSLVALGLLLITSCVNKGTPDASKLARLGNTALTIATQRGAISAKDATLARQAGVLILTAQASDNPLSVISETAVALAVKEGEITPEEAGLLREVGTVLLLPAAAPLTEP